jgi:hypothetical protein
VRFGSLGTWRIGVHEGEYCLERMKERLRSSWSIGVVAALLILQSRLLCAPPYPQSNTDGAQSAKGTTFAALPASDQL